MIEFEENKKNIFLIICLTILTLTIFVFYKITYPFVLAFILAYLLGPINHRLSSFMPNAISSFVALLIFVIIVFLILSLAIPIILAQFEKITISAPKYINYLNETISPYFKSIFGQKKINEEDLFKLLKLFFIKVGDAGYNFFKGGLLILNSLFDILLILIITFYMLLEMKNIRSFFNNITKNSSFSFFSIILEEINLTLSKYIRGQISVCLCLSIFYSLILNFLSLEFGFILGLFIGLISFIPYIGAFLGCFLALILGLVQFGYGFELLIILITFIIGQLLESYFLTPKLVGEAVKLNPIWIIFALSVGGGFFGFIGILMAIPVAAIIGVIARFYFNYIFDDSKNGKKIN